MRQRQQCTPTIGLDSRFMVGSKVKLNTTFTGRKVNYEAKGIIIGFTKDGRVAKIVFSHLKTPTYFHTNFLDLVPEKPYIFK